MAERGFTIGVDGARAWVSADEVQALLARGRILDCQSIPWSSNYTFATLLAAEEHPSFLAIYKPRRGEMPLYDFPDGTLYKRERAAYLVCRALGWDFIPPTIVRDGPHGVGSVQLYVDPEPKAELDDFKHSHRDQLQQIALFDVIANNADRKAGHCLKGRDGRIWGIDHGLTFNAVPKLRTVIWDYAGTAVPEALLRQLAGFRQNPTRVSTLRAELEALLARQEVGAFFDRLDAVLECQTFPMPTSRRSIPWPWY